MTKGISDSQNRRCRFAHRTPAVHVRDRVEHVMVIAPVDAEEDETQHVAQEDRQQRTQDIHVGSGGRMQFQHHNGDDNGDHPITERF